VASFVLAAIVGDDGIPNRPVSVLDPSAPDPFAYSDSRRAEFERRAARGYSHVVYAKSPGGVVATGRRTERYRPLIERVARRARLDPETLESIVFLESAGRPEAVADRKLEGAVGLTQILAETGRNLLGMKVDTAASRKLTRRIARAEAHGQTARTRRLKARRRRVDERFDPSKSVRATARYLNIAREKLGRDDLAVVGYHMGIGNLQSVVGDFGEGDRPSYAKVFFQSSPEDHSDAYRRLSSLGDDSSTYYWRVLASRAILRQLRRDPAALRREAALQTAKGSAENALHPEDRTEVFSGPDALTNAYRANRLRSFPNAPKKLGLRRDPDMGQLAKGIGADRVLYRGLRPEAYALAAYMARMEIEAGGRGRALTVTSTVRDRRYQRLLVGTNLEATRNYSLHTTGYAFDVLRRYSSRRQALAFQFALDRLQALGLIAWVREPAAIHLTVGGDARRLLALLR
jgi:hypothetical protein